MNFWLATLGLVLYAAALWVAGITQGLMAREYGEDGYLVYAFAEIVAAMKPYYAIRVIGGLLYLSGALIMVFNVWMTIIGRLREEAPMSSPKFNPAADRPLAPAAVAAE